MDQKVVCFYVLCRFLPDNFNTNHDFICLLYPEFFFELVLHLYPGEETRGPTAQGVR